MKPHRVLFVLIPLLAVAFFATWFVTSSPDNPGWNQNVCIQAIRKADELLQLAEQSLQLSAKQIIAVSNQDATQMVNYNKRLRDISTQANIVGPEYQHLKKGCTG